MQIYLRFTILWLRFCVLLLFLFKWHELPHSWGLPTLMCPRPWLWLDTKYDWDLHHLVWARSPCLEDACRLSGLREMALNFSPIIIFLCRCLAVRTKPRRTTTAPPSSCLWFGFKSFHKKKCVCESSPKEFTLMCEVCILRNTHV